MPIDFPNSPTNGTQHTANGVTWQYNGTVWNVLSGGSSFSSSATPPSSPKAGDIWFDTDNGKLYTYYDSFWVNPASIGRERIEVPTYQTALPSSPSDGQEIYYAADATNSIIWHLRYRSAARSGGGAWEYVGGPRLESENTGSQNASRTGGVWFSMTSDPAVVLPSRGRYIVTIRGAQFTTNGGGGRHVFSYQIGATEATEADGARADTANATMSATAYKEQAKTFTSASTLTMRYLVYDTGTYWTSDRLLAVLPVFLY